MCWEGISSTGLLWAQLRQTQLNWVSLDGALYPGFLNGMVVQGSMRANPRGKCLLNIYLWPVHDVPLAKSSHCGSASVWEGTIGYQEVTSLEVISITFDHNSPGCLLILGSLCVPSHFFPCVLQFKHLHEGIQLIFLSTYMAHGLPNTWGFRKPAGLG